MSACPVKALENVEMAQQDYWNYAFGDKDGAWQISCHARRDSCPYNLGSGNGGAL